MSEIYRTHPGEVDLIFDDDGDTVVLELKHRTVTDSIEFREHTDILQDMVDEDEWRHVDYEGPE